MEFEVCVWVCVCVCVCVMYPAILNVSRTGCALNSSLFFFYKQKCHGLMFSFFFQMRCTPWRISYETNESPHPKEFQILMENSSRNNKSTLASILIGFSSRLGIRVTAFYTCCCYLNRQNNNERLINRIDPSTHSNQSTTEACQK